jgi:protein Mpv17
MAHVRSAASTVLRTLAVPLIWYNTQLNRNPLVTKSLTSGLMYGLGDISAQATDNYTQNKSRAADDQRPLRVNWRRIAVCTVYGTFIGG